MQPKVSMVVPCYNKVKWIGEMLDSVIAQLWDNIELILVNDGSTDGTREIISEYEPKLKARGYDVVIVDQANQGVAAAVRNGLMRITGEYICIPDCDDLLHPEYVSAMAGYLVEHKDVMWVISNHDCSPYDSESHPALKKNAGSEDVCEYSYKMLECFLLFGRLSPSIWNKMYRACYFNECEIVTKFVIEPRVAQESQISIPLILGGAKPVIINRVLYYYKTREGSIIVNANTASEKIADFVEKYNNIITAVLLAHNAYNDYTKRFMDVLSIYHNYGYLRLFNASEDEYIIDYAEAINNSGLIREHVDTEIALKAGVTATHRWFSNIVIGYPLNRVSISRKMGGRVIANAAFGRASVRVRHGLLNSDIRPDVFWDRAAKPGDQIDGIPVMIPNFDDLVKNDTVLVLLKDATIAQSVKESLEKTPAIENTWYYYDVLDYLADYYFSKNNKEA